MAIRIILADDHEVVRDGLCSLIEREKDMEVIAQTENGRKTVELAKELQPDVIVMDIGMPGLNGIEATRQIIKENSTIKIIALSMHSDQISSGCQKSTLISMPVVSTRMPMTLKKSYRTSTARSMRMRRPTSSSVIRARSSRSTMDTIPVAMPRPASIISPIGDHSCMAWMGSVRLSALKE